MMSFRELVRGSRAVPLGLVLQLGACRAGCGEGKLEGKWGK